MSATEERTHRSMISWKRPIFETIIILILLLSGIGVIFVGKVTGQVTSQLFFIFFGLFIEIIAILLVGIFVYVRYFRQRQIKAS